MKNDSKITPSTMIVGAIYIRVSTDKQEELSPDAQKRLLLEYAKKNNIIISDDFVFTENGISGRKADKRPQFQKMIALAKQKDNPFDVILVWKYSRFARNQEESIVYKSLLKKNNVDVISISEPLIEGPFGSLIERIIEWMDEYYSIRLSGEVVRGMTENALRGAYQAIPPLGYDYVGYKQPPTINEKEKETILFIFNKYLENTSLAGIARALNENGIRSKKGNLFEPRTIDYILKNPFYIGKVRWNYSDRGRELKDKTEWIVSDGCHEPIISEEMFHKVNEKLANNFKKIKSRDVSSCKHWLSGTLVCSCCGRSLSYSKANNNKKTYSHFQCWGYSKGMCKKSHSLPEQDAISNVITGLEEVILLNKVNYETLPLENHTSIDITFFNKQLKNLEQKNLRIKEAYRNGIDTLDEYKENKSILQREREEIELKLQNATVIPFPSNTKENDDRMISNIKNVIAVLKSDTNSYEIKGTAIRSILKDIVYDKENSFFNFHYYLS